MTLQRHPRFSEEELRVIVEEIILVEPQLFGSQMQQTSIARKMELWWRIGTGLTPWDSTSEQGTTSGRGPPANGTGKEVQATSIPSQEEAHSDGSSSACLDLDDQPGPSGISGQSVTQTHSHTITETPPQETPPQHPPSGPIPLSPGQINQQCVHHYKDPRAPHKHRTIRDLGSVAVGTRFRGQRHRAQDNKEAGRTAVRQGEDRPRELTLQEALIVILGAYHHSQDSMGQILDKLQENMRLQEGQYLGIREDLKDINTTLVSIAGVLADMANTMKEAVASHRASATSQTDEQPSTSTAASEQEVCHRTNRPPAPLPLQKVNHPVIQQKPETIAKNPARK
ncbi:hypothetical protein NDU88_007439 [Pleurodeles waltl]|uniref:Phosphoprotein n=1 Tax=Pleurodeles waltl TaxID=8319 RepID=A0AAV7QKY0_PLEWA|nr:hypothetical protein NDU88_007439 [Pleurodeles waltl]